MRLSLPVAAFAILASISLGFVLMPTHNDDDIQALNQGREAMASGDYAAAIQNLTTMEGDPARSGPSLEGHLLLALAHIKNGKPAQGGEVARKLEEALPVGHEGRGRARFLIAEAFEVMGKDDEVARMYAAEAQHVLSDEHLARVAGYYLTMASRLEKEQVSKDPLKPAIPARPDQAADLQLRALKILTGGKPKVDITLPRCRNLIAAGELPATNGKRGNQSHRFYAAAQVELKQLLELKDLSSTQRLEAHFLRGKALLGLNQNTEALNEFQTVLADANSEESKFAASARILMGHALIRLGGDRRAEGIKVWRTFLERHPSDERASEVRVIIAQTLEQDGDLEDAIKAYEEVAADEKAKNDVRAQASYQVGDCLAKLHRYDAARDAYRKYLAGHPNHTLVPQAQALVPDLLLRKAQHRRSEKDLVGAIAAYEEFLSEYPLADQAPSVARELGSLHRERKDIDAARKAYVAARDRYETHNREEAARSGLLLAVVEEEDRKDLESAIKALKEVTQRFSGTSAAGEAQQRIAGLEAIELELVSPRMFAPGEKIAVDLVTRNIKEVDFRLYRLDARSYFERKKTIEGIADIEVALVKSDHKFEWGPTTYVRYQREKASVGVTMADDTLLEAGTYLLAAEAAEKRVIVPIIVSDVRLVVKQAPREVFIWATRATTGQPLEGVELLIRGPDIEKDIKTGVDGVARLKHEKDVDGCQILGVFEDGVAPGLANPAPARTAEALTPRAAFTLDRPIYQPGSQIQYRAAIRDVDRGEFVTPKVGTKVMARLLDAQGRVVGFAESATSKFGVVSGSFSVPSEGNVGEYKVELTMGSHVFQESVTVQAFTKPEYQVRVVPQKAVVRPGEEAAVDADVAYFFGGPVAGAAYECQVWRMPHEIDRTRYLDHAWFFEAVASAQEDRWTPEMEFVQQFAGHLDEDGKASIKVKTDLLSNPTQYTVVFRVRDTAGAWVSGSGAFHMGPVDRFAVVSASNRTLRAGDEAEVKVTTATLGYAPVSTLGKVEALFERITPEGRRAYDEVASSTVDTGLDGTTQVRMKLEKAGEYLMRFEGKDANDQPLFAATRITVTGERPDLEKEALLRLEKDIYMAGEEAKAHLSVPESGRPSLLTFEAETVIDYRIIKPQQAHGIVPIAFEDRHAPNITVAFAMPHKGKLLTTSDSVLVLRYLKVEVEPAETEAEPGEKVGVRVKVTDQMGRPIAGSVALRATDGALSGLGGRIGDDPRFVLNRDLRGHLVSTGSTFEFFFRGQTRAMDADLVALGEEALKEKLANKDGMDLALVSGGVPPAPKPSMRAHVQRPGNAGPGMPTGGGGGTSLGGKFDTMGAPAAASAPAPERAGATLGEDRNFRQAGRGRRSAARGLMDHMEMEGALADLDNEADKLPRLQSLERRKNAVMRYKSVGKNIKRLDEYFAADSKKAAELQERAKAVTATFGRDAVTFGGFAWGEMPMPELRERFLDVAGWWPDLETDAEGLAQVDLELPDNLTRWELLGSGISSGTHAGQGTASIRVSQEFLVSLDRPAALTSVDQAVLPARLQSNVEGDVEARAEFEMGGEGVLRTEGMSQHSFTLPGHGRVRKGWAVTAERAGVSTLEASMQTPRGGDRMKVLLKVIPFGAPWVHVDRRDIADRLDYQVDVPAGAVPGSQSYEVVVEAGMEAEILEGLNYLAGYPYGCLEQSLNRFVPAMMLTKALEDAGRPPAQSREILEAMVTQGLLSLRGYMRDDGTFAYWPGGPAHPWVTAQALETLIAARSFGHTVDPSMVQAAINGNRLIIDDGAVELEARVAAFLALQRAGAADSRLFARFLREKDSLSASGLSRLLLAAHHARRADQVDPLFRALKAKEIKEHECRFPGVPRHPWLHESAEATALALLAYQAAGATSAETDPLVQSVRKGLRRRAGSTRGVALALEALASHITGEGALRSAGTLVVTVDGKKVGTAKLAQDKPVVAITIPVASLAAGKHQINVTKEGGDVASCRLILRHVESTDEVEPSGNVVSVRRRIIDYKDPNQEVTEFEPGFSIVREEHRPRLSEPETLAQALSGGKVTVELSIEAREDLSHLVISDPQCAGLDVIESGIRGKVDRHELRPGALLFFRNTMKKGEKLVVTYPCYAVFEGRFGILPAEVEEMYAPERRGRSGSARFQVVPDPSLLARRAAKEMTADEQYQRGLKAFNDGKLEGALSLLKPLPGKYVLNDDAHDTILKHVLRAELRTERHGDAIQTREALRLRNPGAEALEIKDQERLGRAFMAVGDHLSAREHLQSVILAAYRDEATVPQVLQGLGHHFEAMTHLESAMLRYPLVADVASAQAALAGGWMNLQLPDLSEAERRLLSSSRRVHYRQALDRYLKVMAWQRGRPFAEDAAFRRIDLIRDLGLLEAVVDESKKYLERYEESRRRDQVTARMMSALFELGRYDEAKPFAKKLWDGRWPTAENGRVVQRRSQHRYEAGYLLGRMAHVAGDYKLATSWYGKVKDHMPDAHQSWLFFTSRELEVAPLTKATPDSGVVIPFEGKNIEKLTVQVFPVDLSVLFAVKKSFEGMTSADLAGVVPARKEVVETDIELHRRGQGKIELGKMKPGAYLVVFREKDTAASTLVTVTGAKLTLQRSGGSIRVYVVDSEGRPVSNASVKCGVSGRIFHSGETDERGLLDVKDPGGKLTIVAEKDDLVAVGAW